MIDLYNLPASDKEGHNVPISIRVPKEVGTLLDSLVKNPELPYLNKGFIIRHALHRHFEYLRKVMAKSASTKSRTCLALLSKVNSMLTLLEEDRLIQSFDAVMLSLEERVQTYVSKGEIERAHSYIMKILMELGELPDGYWKEHYSKHIRDKYNYILNNSKLGVRLV